LIGGSNKRFKPFALSIVLNRTNLFFIKLSLLGMQPENLQTLQDVINNSAAIWTENTYKPGEIVFPANERIDRIYRVRNGVFRLFHRENRSENEVTISFFFEGDVITPPANSLTNGNTLFYLSAISSNIPMMPALSYITSENFVSLTKNKNAIGDIALDVLKKIVKHYMTTQISERSVTSVIEEMYNTKHPVLFSGINQKYIASYFGVSLPFYNRTINKLRHIDAE
jgi:CRP-like cAMP-binding protein